MKRLLAAMFSALVLALPASAAAGVCDYTCNVQGIMDRISEAQNTITSRISAAETSIVHSIQAVGAQISVMISQQTAALKELVQGQMNYQAQLRAKKAAANAQLDYSGPQAIPPQVCTTLELGEQTGAASTAAHFTGKAVTAAEVERNMYVKNAHDAYMQIYENHMESYCSSVDQARGRCKKAAPAALQNADIMASTLLSPNAGQTYSSAEYRAAEAFIGNTTNPFPSPMLQQRYERTKHGRDYILAQMTESAQLSVAQTAMSQILADHAPTNADPSNPAHKISVIGLMKQFTDDRFVSPKWKEQLQQKSQPGVLREIAYMMAFHNWMDYRSYVQRERIEALLATNLSLNVKHYDEPILEQQFDEADGRLNKNASAR